MARIRTIKPELPQSESMGKVSRDARGHFKKATITAQMRRDVALRHGCGPGSTVEVQCAYCKFIGSLKWFTQPTDRGPGWVSATGLEFDHAVAEYSGGETSAANLVLACLPCNRSKSSKSVDEWRKYGS